MAATDDVLCVLVKKMKIAVPWVERAESFYLPDCSYVYRLYGGPLGKICEIAFVCEPGGGFVLQSYSTVTEDEYEYERRRITESAQEFIDREITASLALPRKQIRREIAAFRAYRRCELGRVISGVMDSIEANVRGGWPSGQKWPDGVSAERSVEADFPTRGAWAFSHGEFGPLGQVSVRFSGEIPHVSYKDAPPGDEYGMEREIILERLFKAVHRACEAYIKEKGGIGRVEIL